MIFWLSIVGGTASYLLGMSPYIAALQGDPGQVTPINAKSLQLGWMFGFLFAVSFVGLFSIVPLRKVCGIYIKKNHDKHNSMSRICFNEIHVTTCNNLFLIDI